MDGQPNKHDLSLLVIFSDFIGIIVSVSKSGRVLSGPDRTSNR